MHIASAIIVFLILLVGGLVFHWLFKDSEEIYAHIDNLHQKALLAQTREQLLKIRSDAVVFNHERCWHRHHGTAVSRLLAFIDGRMAGIK
jgi:hypothetical protein